MRKSRLLGLDIGVTKAVFKSGHLAKVREILMEWLCKFKGKFLAYSFCEGSELKEEFFDRWLVVCFGRLYFTDDLLEKPHV